MKHIKKFIQFCILAIIMSLTVQINNAKAQTPPIYDSGWFPQPSLSEDFNSSGLSYRWWISDSLPNNFHSCATFSRNVTFTGTSMKLKVDTLIPAVTLGDSTFHYQGATVASWWDYTYGYLEIRAKFPTGEWVWPAFWLWSGWCDDTLKYENEIDIVEQEGQSVVDGDVMGTNWHVYANAPTRCDTINVTTDNPQLIENLPRLDSIYHKYAIEWNPEGMIWYFDDVPVRTVYDPVNTPKHNMAAIFDVWVAPASWSFGQNKPAIDSVFLEVDYMNYYKLNTRCNDTLRICTPSTDYSLRAVQKWIKTGGTGGCSPVFNTSDKYTLRATDYVILDAGTEINPNGSGQFSIQVMQCPE